MLAGGESKRFGSNKALYEIGGEPLVATMCRRVSPLFDNVRILTRNTSLLTDLGFEVLKDLRKEQCPLAGIYSGLKYVGSDKAFFIACDLPLVKVSVVRYIIGESTGYDAAVPQTSDGLEPLCAVYDVGCLEAIERSFRSGNLKADSFLGSVRTKLLEEEDLRRHDPRMVSFWNLNSPEDMPFVEETMARDRAKRCS